MAQLGRSAYGLGATTMAGGGRAANIAACHAHGPTTARDRRHTVWRLLMVFHGKGGEDCKV